MQSARFRSLASSLGAEGPEVAPVSASVALRGLPGSPRLGPSRVSATRDSGWGGRSRMCGSQGRGVGPWVAGDGPPQKSEAPLTQHVVAGGDFPPGAPRPVVSARAVFLLSHQPQ